MQSTGIFVENMEILKIMKHLLWKQRDFKNTIDLNSPEGKAGSLSMSYFSNKESAELYDQKFNFSSKGLFKKKIQISDKKQTSEICSIEYKLLSNKGIIKLSSGEIYSWRCGFTGWVISRNGETIVSCEGLVFNGKVNYEESSELLLLPGFYLASKFLRYPVLLVLLIYCYVLMLYFHR